MLASLPARLVLSPVLLVQALMVRRRALVLPDPSGARQGIAGQGPALRVLILGDSSALGVGTDHQDSALSGRVVAELAQQFTVHWQVEATSGATSADTLAHIRRMEQPSGFDVAISALGVNDLTRQVPISRWTQQQGALTALLQERFAIEAQWRVGLPPMQCFPLLPRPLSSVLGAQARAYDRVLAQATVSPPQGLRALGHLPFDVSRFDPSLMAEDGFHPSAALYEAMARELAPAIAQTFSRTP